MGFTPLQCVPTLTPSHPASLPDNLRLTIMEPGNEQRDYMTVNYSVILELCTKKIKLLVSLFFKENTL